MQCYLFFPRRKADHPSLSAASAASLTVYCSQWVSIVIDLATLIFWRWNGATAPSLPHWASLWVLHVPGGIGMLFSRCSRRIPKESLYQTGMIRQRQSCLESHKSEAQEFPVLSLNPCISSKGAAAMAQVRCVAYPHDTGWREGSGAGSRWFPKFAKALLEDYLFCQPLR